MQASYVSLNQVGGGPSNVFIGRRYETKLANSAIGATAEGGCGADNLTGSASTSTFERGLVVVVD